MSFLNMFNTNTPVTPEAPATPVQPAVAPNAPPAPAAAKLENQTPDTTPVETPNTAPNGVVPDNVNEAKTPLDQYNDLWETPKQDKSTPAEYKPEQLDPAKLQEVMGKAVLTGAISPELQARITAGGEDAQVAMVEAMNNVAQQTMMQSTVVANKMMEQNSTKLMEAMLAKIPGLVKSQSVNNSLQETNPIYSNPAVAPVIDAVKAQMQIKYPNATTAELTGMAQKFVNAMADTLNPVIPEATQSTSGDTDFSDWEKM